MPHSVRALLLVGAAAVSLYFVNLGRSSIWDANEAFYVETPREMIEGGDFIVPAFNYEPRLNKPVLSYWMVAGLYELFGVSVSVQRVGIAIGGLILIAAAGCLGWLASPAAGKPVAASTGALSAAAGLAVDPRLVMFSRRIFIDVWLSAFMALTLAFFVLSERFPQRRRTFLIALYVAVGLGVLTKGPVAAVLPAAAFVTYLALQRELARLRQMMIPLGALIVLAIVLPWHVALYAREGWTSIAAFLFAENVGRYTTGVGVQPPRGVGFYPPVVFADGFPLSLFLVPAAVLWWRDRTSAPRPPHVNTSALLWLWILVIVGFFSLSHDKQDLYILPILPAVAALGASAIVRHVEVPALIRGTSLFLAIVIGAAGAWLICVVRSESVIGAAGRVVGAVAAAGSLAAIGLLMTRRTMGAIVAMLAVLCLANWLVVLRILPDLERYKPAPPLATYLRSHATPQDVLATYNVALPSLVYYLQRHVNVHYAAAGFVEDVLKSSRMFGVLSERDYAALQNEIGARTCVLQRVPAFEMKLKQVLTGAPLPNLVLISNRCEGR